MPIVVAVAGILAASPSLAADPPTVASLLAEGYRVVAAVPTQIGPGLFLQRDASLYACFVSETPDSPDLKTIYCKPVH